MENIKREEVQEVLSKSLRNSPKEGINLEKEIKS